jgi:hypothetical protein
MALMLVEGLNNVPWIVSMPLVSSEGREVARVVRKIKMRPLVYMVFDCLGWGGCDCEEMVVESMDEGFLVSWWIGDDTQQIRWTSAFYAATGTRSSPLHAFRSEQPHTHQRQCDTTTSN